MKKNIHPAQLLVRNIEFPRKGIFARAFVLGCLCLAAASFSAGAASLEVIQLQSAALQGNPLHDPAARPVPIFVPSQATNGARLPVVYYLPGFGNTSQNFINGSNVWLKFTQKIADEVTPVVFVVVDGKTRWGGSQYLNSPAQGEYENYICDDLAVAVESRHPVPAKGIRRVIAGHSSGGFGALRLGMARQGLFDALIALSPDSAFAISHLPLVKVASVAKIPLATVEKIEAGEAPLPKDGDVIYAIALSAAYAPAGEPGRFDWLYDAQGHFRDDIWNRWLDNDPLVIAQKNPRAFGEGQSVYLEGPSGDEYSANIGARKIFEAIKDRPSRSTFYQPPGHHSDHVRERIQRGLQWVFSKPLMDVP